MTANPAIGKLGAQEGPVGCDHARAVVVANFAIEHLLDCRAHERSR